MKNTNKDQQEQKTKSSVTSKEKASFDQNGKGASEKFGEAGTTPNESGKEGVGTTNKHKKSSRK